MYITIRWAYNINTTGALSFFFINSKPLIVSQILRFAVKRAVLPY